MELRIDRYTAPADRNAEQAPTEPIRFDPVTQAAWSFPRRPSNQQETKETAMKKAKQYHGTSKARGCAHARLGPFGRMFPKLPKWSDQYGIANQCEAEELMALLGGSNGPMHDVNDSSDDSDLPAGYTFFAQFVDHDITLDTRSALHQGPDSEANQLDSLGNLVVTADDTGQSLVSVTFRDTVTNVGQSDFHIHSLVATTPGDVGEDLCDYPLVTYVYGFTGRQNFSETFNSAGLQPHVVLSAADTDIIKTYVAEQMGIGIIASMALESLQGTHFQSRDLSHLFPCEVTRVAYLNDKYLRQYERKFIDLLLEHVAQSKDGRLRRP